MKKLLALFAVITGLGVSSATYAARTVVTVQVKPDTLDEPDAAALEDAGISRVRFGVYYSPSFDTFGQKSPDWERYDRLFALLQKHHVRVLMTAFAQPSVIAGQLKEVNAPMHAGIYSAESVRKQLHHDIAIVVREAVRRYGDQIAAVELWNEPDNRRFWTAVPELGGFASAISGICDTVKEFPQLPVYGYGFTLLPGGENQTTSLYDEIKKAGGTTACLSGISGHFYREHAELAIQEVSVARKYTKSEIILTEEGSSSLPGKRTDEAQADLSMRTLLSSILAGVPLASIYEFKDTSTATPEREKHFGALRSNGSHKPLYAALKNFVPIYSTADEANGNCMAGVCRMDIRTKSAHFAILWREMPGSSPLSQWVHEDEIDTKLLRSTDDFYTSSAEIILLTQAPILVRFGK